MKQFHCVLICSLLVQLCGCSAAQEEQETLPGIDIYLENQEISALFDDGQVLWVGGKDGLQWIHRDHGNILQIIDSTIDMTYASDICQTEDATIWVGHNDGLTAFSEDGEKICSFTTPSLPEGRINCLLPVEDGLWVGTMSGAAFLKKEDDSWFVDHILTTQNGLAENCVNIIVQIENSYWFGSYLAQKNGGISILSQQGWDYLSLEDGLPHRYINALCPLSATAVLIGTGHLNLGGLCLAEKDGNQWHITKIWNEKTGIPGEKVRWLFLDQQDYLWITTEFDGVLLCASPAVLSQDTITGIHINQENGLSNNEVKKIVESDTCYWLGSKSGLIRVEKEAIDSWLNP